MEAINGVYTGDEIVVPAWNEANSLYQDGYGSLLRDMRVLALEPFEAMYLVERQRLAVIDEGTRERLVFRELLQRFSESDPHLWTRYIVFRDLRTRGFVARSGASPGIDFLVYERGSFGKKTPTHSVRAVWEGSHEAIGKLGEVLDSVGEAGRDLKLAVIDRRGEVVYYSLDDASFTEDAEDPA